MQKQKIELCPTTSASAQRHPRPWSKGFPSLLRLCWAWLTDSLSKLCSCQLIVISQLCHRNTHLQTNRVRRTPTPPPARRRTTPCLPPRINDRLRWKTDVWSPPNFSPCATAQPQKRTGEYLCVFITVCVYYCSTYYKAVRGVKLCGFITAVFS